MFKVNNRQSFKTKVRVQIPNERGNMTQGEFTAEFKIVDQEILDDMIDENWANSLVIDEVLLSVSDVGDADGNPLAGDEALQEVKANTNAVAAMTTTYFEKMTGGPKGQTSRKRRATG